MGGVGGVHGPNVRARLRGPDNSKRLTRQVTCVMFPLLLRNDGEFHVSKEVNK